MASFEEIQKARKLLELGERARLDDIKNAYRRLSHLHHPDIVTENDSRSEKMKELNWAYELLEDYCSRYKYSFGENDVTEAYPQEAYFNWWRENWQM